MEPKSNDGGVYSKLDAENDLRQEIKQGDNMSTNTYRILMKTPLGERHGTLVLERNGSMLNGWLDIMKHREPFEGTVDEMGNCKDFRRVYYADTQGFLCCKWENFSIFPLVKSRGRAEYF